MEAEQKRNEGRKERYFEGFPLKNIWIAQRRASSESIEAHANLRMLTPETKTNLISLRRSLCVLLPMGLYKWQASRRANQPSYRRMRSKKLDDVPIERAEIREETMRHVAYHQVPTERERRLLFSSFFPVVKTICEKEERGVCGDERV